MNITNVFSILFLLIVFYSKGFCINSSNKSNVDFAINFKIKKEKNRTKITIINPESTSQQTVFYLYPNKKNTIFFGDKSYSTKSIICLSSTFIGLLDKLNEKQRIKGVDNGNFIYNTYIKNEIKKHRIKELGAPEMISSEKVIKLNAKLILYSGFGSPFPNQEKLEKFNVLCLPIYDWKETHPLGKAEWIKLIGVITNKEKEANSYFENLKKRYYKISSKCSKLTISKPLMSGSLIGDVWFLPAGESFLANLFKDAKIKYVERNSKGTGSISKSLEYCIKNYKTAKYWINPGFDSKKKLLVQNKNYKIFQAFTNNTYCYSHNSNLFWEKSAIEPDSLLLDLIQICHPELHIKRKLYFYKKLK